jgi:pimeloyl-ACP methyl ester carboxylesterase
VSAAIGPRWLYLHGFASGPESAKGRALAAHYRDRGVHLERLDLRRPSFERLRLSAIMQVTREALGTPADRAVVFGSSLGALAACRVAEQDARIAALVLLAPAFRLAQRFRERLGEEGWRRWQETGWLPTWDYAEQRERRIDFGFIKEVAAIDGRSGGWPDLRVPTLIVHGRADEVVDVALSRTFAASRRWVRLVEVDDGHELGASIDRIKAEADAFLSPWLVSE